VKYAAFHPPEKYSTKEEVIKVFATFMFNSTGGHEYVGNVREYIDHPRKLGFRMTNSVDPIAPRVDLQSWLTGLLLFSVTTVPMPDLMDDFSSCFTSKHEKEAWWNCSKNLHVLADEIDKREGPKMNSFNPKYLECSVNV